MGQEVGEVWEAAMPKEHPPHRSPVELMAMAKELGMTVKNPMLPEGGIKLFGKVPQKYPETTADGHKRCRVRVQHYVEQSNETQQNFIIVTHAPAVAAMIDIFEHGMCDVEKLEYCARVIATRKLDKGTRDSELKAEKSVFAEQWSVETKGVSFGINLEATED